MQEIMIENSEETAPGFILATGKGLKAKPVIRIILDTRDKEGLEKKNFPEYDREKEPIWPVKLCATFQVMKGEGKKFPQKLFPLYYESGKKVVATQSDFDVASDRKKACRQRVQEQIRKAMVEAEAKAEDCCKTSDFITVEGFKFLYTTAGSLQTVKSVFDLVIAKKKTESTRLNYAAARDKLFRYAPDLTFAEITPDWIKKMLSEIRNESKGKNFGKELSATSKNIYIRDLKLVFNEAIRLRLVKKSAYPFGTGEGLVQMKETEKAHTQLTKEEKDRIEALDFKGVKKKGDAGKLRWVTDMWLLSFYCSGLNTADIFDLKRGEVFGEDGMMEEIRKYRVKNINRNNKQLKIPIDLPEVQQIIARHCAHDLSPDAYVFPVYEKGMDQTARHRAKQTKLLFMNRWLGKIAKMAGIKKHLTTYTARHTFSCILYENGTSIEEIQDMLGHAKKAMTETYVDGFPSKVKKARQQLLRSNKQA